MNLSNLEELKNYLHSHGFRPKDYMGQNFLVDEHVLSAIVNAADLKPSDTVLEVGPGLGVLTSELVQHAGKIIAVEKDERLFEILRKDWGSSPGTGEVRRGRTKALEFTSPNQSPTAGEGESISYSRRGAELFNQDILRFNLSEHVQGPYKVVANIPYYLTSKLFQYFLQQENQPTLLVLMVQKEVGERVVAGPGELSILGISVQVYADVEIAEFVSKDSFWPVPKVDSVILKIIPKKKYPEIWSESAGGGSSSGGKLFFRIVKAAFAGKRKQVHNTLTHGLNLPKAKVLELLRQAGINPSTRP